MQKLLIACLILCTGCAASTAPGVRQNHSGSYHFVVNEHYERVYREALYYARDNHEKSFVLNDRYVTSELYPELREAEISYARSDMFGLRDVFMLIDICGVEQKSDVSIYYSIVTWKSAAHGIKNHLLALENQ
jgi:hypothetical protein